jgi:hypothetical protein
MLHFRQISDGRLETEERTYRRAFFRVPLRRLTFLGDNGL